MKLRAGGIERKDQSMAKKHSGESVYRIVDVVGVSEKSWEDAGRRAVEDYFAVDRYAERVLKTYSKAIDRSRRKLARLKARE